MSAAVATRLAKARKLIQQRGLHKRAFSSRSSAALCSVGALNVAAGRKPSDFNIAESTTWRAYGLLNRAVGGSIQKWNDRASRTQAEVIEAFRKAEQLARAS